MFGIELANIKPNINKWKKNQNFNNKKFVDQIHEEREKAKTLGAAFWTEKKIN